MTTFGEELKQAIGRVEIDKAAIMSRLSSEGAWLAHREAIFDLIAANIKTINLVDAEIRKEEKNGKKENH